MVAIWTWTLKKDQVSKSLRDQPIISSFWEGLFPSLVVPTAKIYCDVCISRIHLLAPIIIRFDMYIKQLGRGRGGSNGGIFQVPCLLVCLSNALSISTSISNVLLWVLASLFCRMSLLKGIFSVAISHKRFFSSRIFIYLAFFFTKVSCFA